MSIRTYVERRSGTCIACDHHVRDEPVLVAPHGDGEAIIELRHLADPMYTHLRPPPGQVPAEFRIVDVEDPANPAPASSGA